MDLWSHPPLSRSSPYPCFCSGRLCRPPTSPLCLHYSQFHRVEAGESSSSPCFRIAGLHRTIPRYLLPHYRKFYKAVTRLENPVLILASELLVCTASPPRLPLPHSRYYGKFGEIVVTRLENSLPIYASELFSVCIAPTHPPHLNFPPPPTHPLYFGVFHKHQIVTRQENPLPRLCFRIACLRRTPAPSSFSSPVLPFFLSPFCVVR